MIGHLIAITLALIIDGFIGDPPNWPHPVRWIGRMIAFFEQKWNHGVLRKLKGIGMVWIIISCTWLITWCLVYAVYMIHPAIGVVFEGILIATTIAQKGLADAAKVVFQPILLVEIQTIYRKKKWFVQRSKQ
jgi:adenosylcobinamide-phosphate synthase